MSEPAFIPFALPDVGEAEALAVADAVRSGWVTSGPHMREFENEFADYVGGGVEAVAVNSATAGLHLSLESMGVGPGDEVIVPDWTFTATAEVVRYLGARPVIVDVERDTLNISLTAVEAAITPRTKVVMPVHFAGLPVDLLSLREVIGESGIRIVEDAAHTLPAVGAAGRVGSGAASDATVFSFYATKTITTGEGGMITTRDPAIAARARVMRLHGIDRDAFDRYTSSKPAWAYDVVAPGYKYNMPDTAASIGRVQLARADEMHRRRKAIAERYLAAFADLPITLPTQAPEGHTHSWHLFVVRLTPEAGIERDDFVAAMSAARVGTSVHFIPLHQHSYWSDFVANPAVTLPVATREGPLAVSLPIFSKMTDDEVDRVVAAVTTALRQTAFRAS